jgi:hypothetical protein
LTSRALRSGCASLSPNQSFKPTPTARLNSGVRPRRSNGDFVKQLSTAIFIAFLAAAPASAAARDYTEKLPTELWVGGDDSLTQKFAATLRESLEASDDFMAEPDAGGYALRMTVPTHLYFKSAQGRTNFQYVVVLTDSNSVYLGISIGSCWEDSMDTCSQRVLSDARLAWASRPRPN